MIPVAIVVVLALVYLLVPGFRAFAKEAFDVISSGELQRVREWLQGFGPWSLAVIIGILIIQPLLLVVPSVLMMVVAVLAYGSVWGGLLALVGSTLAALVGYAVGWALNPVTVDRILGEDTEDRIERYMERYGFWAVAIFRVSPILSTDAISVVAGLLEMNLWRYTAATVLGFLPLAGTIAILGGRLDQMESVLIWGSVASLVLLVAWIAYNEFRKRGS